jgi:hypothetical protein
MGLSSVGQELGAWCENMERALSSQTRILYGHPSRRLPVACSAHAYDFLLGHVALPPAPRLLDLGAEQGNGPCPASWRLDRDCGCERPSPFGRPFEWFEHRFISPLTHAYTAKEYF